jgi:DNA-binding protein HU-beta
MKKEELVTFVAEKSDITKKAANDAVNAVFEGITSSLEKGDAISITGFGSFKVVERAAREGRNPSTGEKIQIKASKGVKFSVGAGLKKSVAK